MVQKLKIFEEDKTANIPVDLATYPAAVFMDVGASLVLQQIIMHTKRSTAHFTRVSYLDACVSNAP